MARRSCIFVVFVSISVTYLAVGTSAYSQTDDQNRKIKVPNISSGVARTHDPSDVFIASLEVLFDNPEICCGRDAALTDSAQAADARPLKEIAVKLEGRHLLGDGRPIHVTAEYLSPEAATASRIVSAIKDQHPLLMQWNSQFYVVYGVDYVQIEDYSTGAVEMFTRKLLLCDTRYSDERRNIVFDREKEDPGKVQGLLFLDWRMN